MLAPKTLHINSIMHQLKTKNFRATSSLAKSFGLNLFAVKLIIFSLPRI